MSVSLLRRGRSNQRRRLLHSRVSSTEPPDARAGDCPCSVREQPPTPADSDQGRTGNIEELSEVTVASWSLSLAQAGLKTGEATGPLPSPGEEVQQLMDEPGDRYQVANGLQTERSDCPGQRVARMLSCGREAP